MYLQFTEYVHYCKCPKISNTKVSDKMPYVNIADPDQIASDQSLQSFPFH